MHRKLAVYILLDISESMIGRPIELLQSGVESLIKILKKDPHAMESMYVSIITFAIKANTVVPLTELFDVSLPSLSVRPGTSLGAALKLVDSSIKKDLVKSTQNMRGDYKPLVFILTDGEPTDEWKLPLQALKDSSMAPDIICVGCGEEADFSILTQITENCIYIHDIKDETISKFFKWMSSSLNHHSKSIAASDTKINLVKVPLPDKVTLVKRDAIPQKIVFPKLYLNSACNKTREKYVMIYIFSTYFDCYIFKSAHRISDDFYDDGANITQPIDGSKLQGAPICPFCGNKSWYLCGVCNNFSCYDPDDTSEHLTCPHCKTVSGKPIVKDFKIEGIVG